MLLQPLLVNSSSGPSGFVFMSSKARFFLFPPLLPCCFNIHFSLFLLVLFGFVFHLLEEKSPDEAY